MHSLMADEGPKPARVEAEAPKQETHYEFQAPERAIFSQADLTAFCASEVRRPRRRRPRVSTAPHSGANVTAGVSSTRIRFPLGVIAACGRGASADVPRPLALRQAPLPLREGEAHLGGVQGIRGGSLPHRVGPVDRPITRASLPQTLRAICEVLHEMEGWIDEFPPLEQPMRFGNKAFRSWHQRLLDVSGMRALTVAACDSLPAGGDRGIAPCRRARGPVSGADMALARALQRSEDIMRRILPGRLHGAVVELAPYIGDAFGNQTRIDYGTGHETTFVFWMCAWPLHAGIEAPPKSVAGRGETAHCLRPARAWRP